MNQLDTLHPYWLVIISLVFALVPMVVALCSSYLKVSIVLGLLRSGLGAQQVPSAMLVMALSAGLSAYIMGPVCSQTWELVQTIDTHALGKQPNLSALNQFAPLLNPWREFMLRHAGEREIATLLLDEKPITTGSAQQESPRQSLKERAKGDLRVLAPAFLLSEIKEAFAMGFVLLLPFLVIDLVVANILAGLGMMMVSPSMISLPLKLILFVAADGCLLLSRSLILSYGS